MTRERSSGSRRTVLAASLAATAGLVGGMALKTVGPSASANRSTAGVSQANTATNAPTSDDQDSTGVWIDDGGREGDDGGYYQPAVPSPNLGGVRGGGPVVSTHGS